MVDRDEREHLVLRAFFHSLSIDSDRFAPHDEKVDEQADDEGDDNATDRENSYVDDFYSFFVLRVSILFFSISDFVLFFVQIVF